MNVWKKECVGLQRTWVSKRTVFVDKIAYSFLRLNFEQMNFIASQLGHIKKTPWIDFGQAI